MDMPLTMAASGEINTVKRIQGRDETKRFLASLGFVEGQNCTEQEHGQPNHDLERRLRRFA